jgi:16S rRNA processing protein RimM
MSTSISKTPDELTAVNADLVEVGYVARAHGVRGAVIVKLVTDRRERMEPGTRLFDGHDWVEVVTARPQPNGSWLVQLAGLVTRTDAEALVGHALSAPPIDDPDALWVRDLIGATVVDVAGVAHGRCVAVIDNPAHDLLELDSGALVPVVFVTGIVDGVITIDPPDGLFDLDS